MRQGSEGAAAAAAAAMPFANLRRRGGQGRQLDGKGNVSEPKFGSNEVQDITP